MAKSSLATGQVLMIQGARAQMATMRFIKTALESTYRAAILWRSRKKISEIDVRENSAALLVRALQATVNQKATPEERGWIESIESIRSELCTSSRKIQIINYGAGSRDDSLKPKHLDRGHILTKTVGEVCRRASTSGVRATLLLKLIREFKPQICLELGTCLGMSACYQAAALRLNGSGILITLEGAPSLAALATQNVERLGLDNVKLVTGRFQDTLARVLDEHAPVDYAFIDGHHDEEATLYYFEQIAPALSNRAILVFDDISWSEGMKRAWRVIEQDDRVRISVNLKSAGICILDQQHEQKQKLEIPIV